MQVAPLAFGPQVVAALKRFAAPESECRFERGGVVAVVVRGGEPLVEVVEVDADVGAVELVALAVVKPRLAERALGLADGQLSPAPGHRSPSQRGASRPADPHSRSLPAHPNAFEPSDARLWINASAMRTD